MSRSPLSKSSLPRRGVALPLVLLVLLGLVPLVFVFSNLSRVELVRTRRSQSGLLATSLAEEGVQLLRSGLETGSPALTLAGTRPHGDFEAYLYAVPGNDPTRRLLYALAKGRSDDVVRVLLVTLEMVRQPRVTRGIVIPHDTWVAYTDREIASPDTARAVIEERATHLVTRVEQLVRERAFTDATFATRLESLRRHAGNATLDERWSAVKTAMLQGRSKP